MFDQLIIKSLLIACLLGLLFILLVQRPGARPQAIRRITYVVLLLGGICVVVFPTLVTKIANSIGVGRGTDLLLYGLFIVFISHSIASKSRHAQANLVSTKLARHIAIAEAPPATLAGQAAVERLRQEQNEDERHEDEQAGSTYK